MGESFTGKSENIDLYTVSASALNISSRMKLAWMLNPEQSLCSTNGIARDYRGLAELMEFEYNDIKNFQRSDDPTMKLLESWTSKGPNNTLGMLLSFLEEMERYDVIEDCITLFSRDASSYLSKKSNQNPIQVPEVTSCKSTSFQMEISSALTVTDAHYGTCTYYDAYVCYADEDLPFVWQLAEFLESDAVKLKLFIKDRDLLAGASEPDSHVFLIQERCSRMLIILSPEFLLSPACEFQTSFAAGLVMEQKRRKLIPIVIKPCNIPNILKFVTKIDFTKPVVRNWVWEKLIQSIRGTNSSVFVSPSVVPQTNLYLDRLQTGNDNHSPNIMITFPMSEKHSPAPIDSSDNSLPMMSLIPTSVNIESTSIQSLPITTSPVQKITPPSKKKFLHKFKHRFISSNVSNASAHTSLSPVTSGYQTQNTLITDTNNDFES